MRLRECDACDAQIAQHDLRNEVGRTWVMLADGNQWMVDACGAACAQVLLAEHLRLVTELAVVR